MPSTPVLPHSRPVRLGDTADQSVAPAVWALVERGVERRPELAVDLRGVFELRFEGGFAVTRVVFAREEIVVEDGEEGRADLVIEGRLSDVLALMTVPLARGWPKPTSAAGRRVLGWLASGRVRLDGPASLAKSFLQIVHLTAH